MSDDIGLHKINNPNKEYGAVSMHLYCPPFQSCKVWATEGVNQLSQAEVANVGYFSVYGHRSPHLEGRPGAHAKVMVDIVEATSKRRHSE